MHFDMCFTWKSTNKVTNSIYRCRKSSVQFSTGNYNFFTIFHSKAQNMQIVIMNWNISIIWFVTRFLSCALKPFRKIRIKGFTHLIIQTLNVHTWCFELIDVIGKSIIILSIFDKCACPQIDRVKILPTVDNLFGAFLLLTISREKKIHKRKTIDSLSSMPRCEKFYALSTRANHCHPMHMALLWKRLQARCHLFSKYKQLIEGKKVLGPLLVVFLASFVIFSLIFGSKNIQNVWIHQFLKCLFQWLISNHKSHFKNSPPLDAFRKRPVLKWLASQNKITKALLNKRISNAENYFRYLLILFNKLYIYNMMRWHNQRKVRRRCFSSGNISTEIYTNIGLCDSIKADSISLLTHWLYISFVWVFPSFWMRETSHT